MSKVKRQKVKGKISAGLAGRRFRTFDSLLFTFYFSLLFTFYLPSAASAQDDPAALPPPPLKILSKDERTRLEAETDLKDRTKLTLQLMTARLTAAETFSSRDDFDGVFRELGGFHGLMDNGIAFLQKRGAAGKVLDNFKRIELALRGFIPRLETIRRELPVSHEDYMRKLLLYVREARTKATEPLFGDTVLPGRRPGN